MGPSVGPNRSGSWTVGQGTGEEILRTLSRTFSGNKDEEQRWSTASDISTSKAEDWKYMSEVKEMQQITEKDNVKGRSLGVTWTDLTVRPSLFKRELHSIVTNNKPV